MEDTNEDVVQPMSEEIKQLGRLFSAAQVTPSPLVEPVAIDVAIDTAKDNAIDSASDSESDSETMATVVKRKREKIASARTRAQVGQKKQANAMLAKNKKKANSYKIGDIVLLKVIFLIV